jgi:spore maturation protein A
MINKIWAFFIIVGILFSLFTGNIDTLNDTILKSASNGVDMVLDLIPIIVLWSGIMKIAEDSEILFKIAKFFSPLLKKLFPTLKNNDKALGYIASNITANALGLGNAATPFGLKAMEEMQKENEQKDTATPAMITFLVLNTSGVTIIPTTTIALRMMYGSNNPEEIIITAIIATVISSIAGLLLDYIRRRKNS